MKSWTEYCIENFDDLLKAQQAKQNESEGLQETDDTVASGAAAGAGGSSD